MKKIYIIKTITGTDEDIDCEVEAFTTEEARDRRFDEIIEYYQTTELPFIVFWILAKDKINIQGEEE